MDDLISPAELHERRQVDDATTVIDVRGSAGYDEGHRPRVLNIPADELPSRLPEIQPDRPVVTHRNMRHRGHSRGERTAALLRASGHDARAPDGGFPECDFRGLLVGRER